MIFILFIFILLAYLNFSKGQRVKPFIILVCSVLFLLSGFRHETVGSDTYGTMMMFERCAAKQWGDIMGNFITNYLTPSELGKDPGEEVFYKLISYIIPNSRLFLFVIAGVTISSFGYFFYRNCNSMKEVMFSFFFYLTFFYQYLPNSSARQSLAVSVILLAYLFLKDQKYAYFVLLVLLASTFHKSSLICLVQIPFMFLRNIKMVYRLSVAAFVFVLFYYKEVGLFLGGGSDIYSSYAESSYYMYSSKPYMVVLLMAAFYALGFLGINRDPDVKSNNLMYIGSIFTFVLTPMIWFNPTLLRIIAYFGPWMAISVVRSTRQLPTGQGSLLFKCIIIVFLIKGLLSPEEYAFMWQEMKMIE